MDGVLLDSPPRPQPAVTDTTKNGAVDGQIGDRFVHGLWVCPACIVSIRDGFLLVVTRLTRSQNELLSLFELVGPRTRDSALT
eukprot:6219980-Amphidinium_carterae.1